MGTTELPSIAEIFAGVLARVPPAEHALLIAIAERLAAERYRGWAKDPANQGHRRELEACAEREEDIARRVEALHPGAEAVQRAILARNPDLEELNRALFAGRPLAEQLTIQARGERIGAATWRAFAAQDEGEAARRTYQECALLEEASAACLEAMLGGGG